MCVACISHTLGRAPTTPDRRPEGTNLGSAHAGPLCDGDEIFLASAPNSSNASQNTVTLRAPQIPGLEAGKSEARRRDGGRNSRKRFLDFSAPVRRTRQRTGRSPASEGRHGQSGTAPGEDFSDAPPSREKTKLDNKYVENFHKAMSDISHKRCW